MLEIFDWYGYPLLCLYAGLIVLCVALGVGVRQLLFGPWTNPHPTEPELTDDDLAYLAGGKARLFAVATVRLVRAGHLTANASYTQFQAVTTPTGEGPDAAAYACHAKAKDYTVAEAGFTATIEVDETKLRSLGLLIPWGRAMAGYGINVSAFVALAGFGGFKLYRGILHHDALPTLLLVPFVCVELYLLLLLLVNDSYVSVYGDAVVTREQALNAGWILKTKPIPESDAAKASALFGIGVMGAKGIL